uniref:Putative glycine-rich cell wall structural protein-like cimex lectularius n=1 Tax=Rhodnius prolixus TaxID=13249 RepID=A0A4V0Y8V0_RHOPR
MYKLTYLIVLCLLVESFAAPIEEANDRDKREANPHHHSKVKIKIYEGGHGRKIVYKEKGPIVGAGSFATSYSFGSPFSSAGSYASAGSFASSG